MGLLQVVHIATPWPPVLQLDVLLACAHTPLLHCVYGGLHTPSECFKVVFLAQQGKGVLTQSMGRRLTRSL